MIQKDRVAQAIFRAIDEINQQMPSTQRLDKSIETALAGRSGSLDSLMLVNLIVATEESIEEEFGFMINIADQQAMSQENSPFQTVGTLSDYISSILERNSNGTETI